MSSKRRQNRVAQRIRQEASNIILQELNDPRMGFITITNAQISADLQFARIYFSVLGGGGVESRTVAALEQAKGYVQRTIAQRIGLRRAPVITFHIDDTVKKTARILGLIAQIKEGREETTEEKGEHVPPDEDSSQEER